MELSAQKKILRAEAKALRERLHRAQPDLASALAAHGATLPIPADAVVSGYIAMGAEADPHALLALLAGKGCTVVYPRVAAMGLPLAFHRRHAGQDWVVSRFGVSEPAEHWQAAEPDFLLVPLLAFDAEGHRLGYGGGFYDRTLAELRARKTITAVGVAFAGQEMEAIVHDAHDQKLDMVVTERGVRRFG